MRSGAQSLPCRLVMSAPIMESGSIIRRMGRFWMEASPVRVVSKGCPARMPEISLVVVPLLPVSRIAPGLCRPWSPLPWIRIWSGVFSMEMPILRKQSIVERQSAPCKKLSTSVVPSAREPNITAR